MLKDDVLPNQLQLFSVHSSILVLHRARRINIPDNATSHA